MPMSPNLPELHWWRLHFRRPITSDQVVEVLRLLAHDPRRPFVVLEARVHRGQVSYLLGTTPAAAESCAQVVSSTLPGTVATEAGVERHRMNTAVTLKVRGTERPLRRDHVEATIAAVLAATSHQPHGTVVQLVLGDRRPALLSTQRNQHPLSPRETRRPDAETLSARRQKYAEPAFGCVIRIGSTSPVQSASMGIFQALSTLEAAGVRLRAIRDDPAKLDAARVPWIWSQYLNIAELAAFTVWPVGDGDLPGVGSLHPVLLPPTTKAETAPEYVIADAAAPGHQGQPLGMDITASLRSLWALGPPGVGKSVLLSNLVLQDIEAGRGALFLDPKGDAIADVLARIPEHRHGDVVILDPTDETPVGLNPLAGGQADVRAEGLLEVFVSLFGDGIGPRSRDILHHALLALCLRGDASLPMLPLLLTNAGFRRSVIHRVAAADPMGLGAFWSWFEQLSDGERTAVIAPVLNKVRIFTTNRRLRAILGQRTPRFDLRQIFTERKIVLVPLQSGVLGESAARLLGSLIVAELVQVTRSRASIPEHRRTPVIVTIDELHQYVHIGDLGEALGLFRGYGVGFRLANQHIAQLPIPLREAMLGTVRSRVVFQTNHRDALELAKGHREVSADDFTSLPAYAVYASLMRGNTASGYVSGVTRSLGSPVTDPDSLRRASRDRYGQALDEVEADLAALVETPTGASQTPSGRRRRST
jgi:hypothetical protein